MNGSLCHSGNIASDNREHVAHVKIETCGGWHSVTSPPSSITAWLVLLCSAACQTSASGDNMSIDHVTVIDQSHVNSPISNTPPTQRTISVQYSLSQKTCSLSVKYVLISIKLAGMSRNKHLPKLFIKCKLHLIYVLHNLGKFEVTDWAVNAVLSYLVHLNGHLPNFV